MDHVEAEGRSAQLEAADRGSVAGSEAAAGLEESMWFGRSKTVVGWSPRVKA